MLLIGPTLEEVERRIVYNSKIMQLMKLPVLNDSDNSTICNKKLNHIIRKCITKTSQNPNGLGEKFKPVTIEDVVYSDYGDIRLTISILQSSTISSDIFGNPRIEINIYYDNNNPDTAFKILDLLSNEFSGKNLDVMWEDDSGNKHISSRELTCEGMVTQNPNINNYERMGIRFSFYVSHYVPYC